MVGFYIGNTDNDWFDFLASRQHFDEINFWKPTPKNFAAIEPGEMFVFRLKSPRNKLGGFGWFSRASIAPINWAWLAFGEQNGTASIEHLVRSVAQYRKDTAITEYDEIGCRILFNPVFLPPELWLDVPDNWSGNIVGGKRYNTRDRDAEILWDSLLHAASLVSVEPAQSGGFSDAGQARYGEPSLVVPRLGQGGFRIAVADAYRRQCAVSGGKVLPALDAAHIQPFSQGGRHVISNGVLMRKDIHSVFDAGFATIDTSFRFVVSDKVRTMFNNGEEYRRLHGRKILLPESPIAGPDRDLLTWHNERVFRG